MVPLPHHDFHPQAWMGHRSRQGGSAQSLGRPGSCSLRERLPSTAQGRGDARQAAVQLSRCLSPAGGAGCSPDRLEPLQRPLGRGASPPPPGPRSRVCGAPSARRRAARLPREANAAGSAHGGELLAGRGREASHAWGRFILTQRVGSHGGGCRLLRDPVFPHRGFQPAGVLAGPLESRGLKASENLGRQVAHCQGLSTGVQGALLGPQCSGQPRPPAASRAMPPQSSREVPL